jgi:hypothetical protein
MSSSRRFFEQGYDDHALKDLESPQAIVEPKAA